MKNNYFIFFTLLFCTTLFGTESENRFPLLKRLEQVLHTRAILQLAMDGQDTENDDVQEHAVDIVGRDKVELGEDFGWHLLQMAYARIPASYEETKDIEPQPSKHECEIALLRFVCSLPEHREKLLRGLATNTLHLSMRTYPQRNSLLTKLVRLEGFNPNFLYSSPDDCEPGISSLLHRYAADYVDLGVVKHFLSLGANPKFANENGKTAADLVREKMKNPAHQSQRPQLETILGLLEFYTNLSRT